MKANNLERLYLHALESRDIKVKARMLLILSKLNKDNRLIGMIKLLKQSEDDFMKELDEVKRIEKEVRKELRKEKVNR
jgi:hypothetical protein